MQNNECKKARSRHTQVWKNLSLMSGMPTMVFQSIEILISLTTYLTSIWFILFQSRIV